MSMCGSRIPSPGHGDAVFGRRPLPAEDLLSDRSTIPRSRLIVQLCLAQESEVNEQFVYVYAWDGTG